MTLILDGMRYTLDADYDPDTGASYSWEGVAPGCPSCGEGLDTHGDDYHVDPVSLDTWQVRCVYCDHFMTLETTR